MDDLLSMSFEKHSTLAKPVQPNSMTERLKSLCSNRSDFHIESWFCKPSLAGPIKRNFKNNLWAQRKTQKEEQIKESNLAKKPLMSERKELSNIPSLENSVFKQKEVLIKRNRKYVDVPFSNFLQPRLELALLSQAKSRSGEKLSKKSSNFLNQIPQVKSCNSTSLNVPNTERLLIANTGELFSKINKAKELKKVDRKRKEAEIIAMKRKASLKNSMLKYYKNIGSDSYSKPRPSNIQKTRKFDSLPSIKFEKKKPQEINSIPRFSSVFNPGNSNETGEKKFKHKY